MAFKSGLRSTAGANGEKSKASIQWPRRRPFGDTAERAWPGRWCRPLGEGGRRPTQGERFLAKKGPILRSALEGIPEPEGVERIRGDKRLASCPVAKAKPAWCKSGFALTTLPTRGRQSALSAYRLTGWIGAHPWLDLRAAFLAAAPAFLAAVVALVVTALKLASATSEACLTAFCTDSNALLAAATALFIMATAVSEPAGAFLAALSTRAANWAWPSATLPSKALLNSALVPEAMSYR